MKRYETYEEAKAAYPDCDAVLTTGPEWEYCQSIVGGFFPAQATCNHDGYVYSEDHGIFPTMSSSGYVVADPPTQAKPKTKVEYKPVDATANEIAKRMIDGEVFYSGCGSVSHKWNGLGFTNSNDEPISIIGSFYQKVEAPMTWQEEVKEFLNKSPYISDSSGVAALFSSDKRIKNEAIELCKLVAKRNGGCE